jgi:hypothetical protein
MLIGHERIHRVYRAGACPVLEVTVTYPCLRGEEGAVEPLDGAKIRFNDFYQSLAERVLAWAEGGLRDAIMEDFTAAGNGAAYRFDRRCLLCEMTATLSEVPNGTLTVTRVMSFSCRRGSMETRSMTATDVWRREDFTLRPTREHRG